MARKPPSDDEGSIVILDSDTEEEKVCSYMQQNPSKIFTYK
jgi:hypothetical protein